MPPQPHVQHNGHPGLPHNPWGAIPGDPWGMHYGLHAQELKQEIKPLPGEYGRGVVHHPMHHPAAWQPPVTGAYLGMGTNSGTNSPSPVHGLQHPAYGMSPTSFLRWSYESQPSKAPKSISWHGMPWHAAPELT